MKKKATILLVEDNRMDIELTLDALREARLDNDIRVVETGEAALDYLLGRGEFADRSAHPLPDIVLLDIKLPGISGIDVLKTIKGTPGLKRLPVIILTSSRDEGDRITSYDHGVNSYLVKPISFDGFLEVIKTLTDYWLTLNINAPIEIEKPEE
ncbi:MAG: response regulator [Deltaproteobacteria bacterium]|nr:response regulator [Deltaproteobacteria bacterium]